MKFGQLIEYNIRSIFLEKSYTKYDEETSPRTLSKKFKLTFPLDQQFEILYSLFLFYVPIMGYQNILKLRR